ncbi:MarR family transcriptional regulator [Brucepastera parasyntrophica]|uniref:MarR family winged helix-turn-helix transcriptional regulator n=1 Tax=Brucepastera parasyntrophica TaxID=2880008 RepID=UPI00210ED410|nr:MarR family transcriptional regulator [Brucepastera parasyntrophica]ULQ59293.1 MarR family transcriptional regulator [Brucepastera parasyntrophica]
MDEMNNDLTELFFRFEALLHRYQMYNFRNFGPFSNPHRGQGRVLAILKMQPEISQKDLGYLLDMRNQSLGELLTKLERSGYIKRTPSETDRRIMNISLTPDGAKAAEETEENQPGINNPFECLDEQEREKLGGYLERLIAELEKYLSENGGEDCGVDGPMSGRFGHGHFHGGPGFGPEGRDRNGDPRQGGHGHDRRGPGRRDFRR